ncbi:tRNA isopentenyl-2-thiomethyl-A-37 hydroxylase MiaE [Aliiglaciecola sp. M165]|uniref:tRNA isopentenyl-2-thiomethyl-A-37 hydroxylase MiaE n=1 Tax=Aliiglaciecola sp. M165 TaxID=2593649 RepID=UPI00163D76A4
MNIDLNIGTLLKPISDFQKCPTPQRWNEQVIKPEYSPSLLVEHATCKLKA